MIKEGQRHLEASCEVIISVLREKRLPEPTLMELHKELSSKQYTTVLSRSQQYIQCLPSPEGAVLMLTSGWESLCRLNAIRLKQVKRQWQQIKLAQEPGDLREASRFCQEVSEECAASHLGLYKVNAWKNRLTHIRNTTDRLKEKRRKSVSL